jgi:polyisoprenoid-binding protein YceI
MRTRSALIVAAIGLTLVPVVVALGSTNSLTNSYDVDGTHSSVIFRVKHMNVAYFYGRFNDVSGSYSLNGDGAAFDITIKVDSVDTNSDGRDKHLKSPDFFNAKQYPTIHFKSTATKQTAENTYEVTGELNLHGVKRPLTVVVEQTGAGKGRRGEQRTGLETTFTIKRSDFGMDFMLGGLGDEVRVTVSLEGVQQ